MLIARAARSARRLAELEQVAAGFAAARTSTTVARVVVGQGLRALAAQARALSAERAAITAQANALLARQQSSYLAEVSAMLASTTDLAAVLEQMSWLAVPPLGDWCQIRLDAPDGTIRHHTLAHSTPADAAALARLADRGPIDLTDPTPDADQALLLEQLTPGDAWPHRAGRRPPGTAHRPGPRVGDGRAAGGQDPHPRHHHPGQL